MSCFSESIVGPLILVSDLYLCDLASQRLLGEQAMSNVDIFLIGFVCWDDRDVKNVKVLRI